MDLAIVLERLLPGCQYTLSSSVPTHEIIEWRDSRPRPSKEDLAAEWEKYLQEKEDKDLQEGQIISDIDLKGKHYWALINGVLSEISLLEKL